MASDKSKSSTKRVKIDKAQRNMFIAVCLASIIVGVTIVASIWFVRKIRFNNKFAKQQEYVIDDLKKSQANLDALAVSVEELTSNEALEVVAQSKESKSQNQKLRELCASLLDEEKADAKDSSSSNSSSKSNNSNSSSSEEDEEDANNSYELAKTCSALRVIPDALPSGKNEVATLGSLDFLISDLVNVEALSGDNGSRYSSYSKKSTRSVTKSVNSINANVSMSDSAARINAALNGIENSIRNYDIRSAKLSWTDDTRSGDSIDFSATFSAYYSNEVNAEVKTRVICADGKSKECLKKSKTGDQSVKR